MLVNPLDMVIISRCIAVDSSPDRLKVPEPTEHEVLVQNLHLPLAGRISRVVLSQELEAAKLQEHASHLLMLCAGLHGMPACTSEQRPADSHCSPATGISQQFYQFLR